MTQPMPHGYATGQMAGIMRVQPAYPPWPEITSELFWLYEPPWRTFRAVPMTRRSVWQPWPWRTWGYPRGRTAYIPQMWPPYAYWYGWWGPEAPMDMGWGGAAWPATTSWGRVAMPSSAAPDVVGGEAAGQMLYGPRSQNPQPLPVGVDPLQGPKPPWIPFDPLEGPVPPTYY
jgi:hypothetical protein